MPSNASHIAQLIIKQLNDDITIEEKEELQAWIDRSESNKAMADQFLVDENLFNGLKETFNAEEKVWNRLSTHITDQPAKVRSIKPWIKWTAAAAIIIAIATVAVFSLQTKDHTTNPPVAKVTDVPAPANNRAVITLADGTKLYLDSSGSGVLAQQNSVTVVKNEKGEVEYRSAITGSPLTLSYNTAFNPRGSKALSLTLSDGTKVWLNSESSLRYPASFASSAVRDVEITGEAYFEVAHNSKQPFKVHLPNGAIVEDIGTSFNINAYADEDAIKTTLIEGSVRVSNGSPDHRITKSQILKPGQQARLVSGELSVVSNVDLEQVMAWKNGLFSFKSTDLKTLMNQIARWYDVDVNYEGIQKIRLSGYVSRDVPLSQTLELLQSNGVHFRREANKIVMLP
jgi:ferric-dicitrate binding protein FerR (iron transport regulator)